LQLRIRPVLALLTCCAVTATGVSTAYARQGDNSDACQNHLKQLGVAMLLYAHDYNDVLPPTKSLPRLQKLLQPYLKSKELFTCPATHLPYQASSSLSARTLASIKSPATEPGFCDTRPHADGSYGVVYMDGHADRVKSNPIPGVQKKTPRRQ
jgi:hypothetical protein